MRHKSGPHETAEQHVKNNRRCNIAIDDTPEIGAKRRFFRRRHQAQNDESRETSWTPSKQPARSFPCRLTKFAPRTGMRYWRHKLSAADK